MYKHRKERTILAPAKPAAHGKYCCSFINPKTNNTGIVVYSKENHFRQGLVGSGTVDDIAVNNHAGGVVQWCE